MKSLKEKGITLVALVVTIVIMLILAGVTINIALGENGLFKQSKKAVDKYKEAQEQEDSTLRELDDILGEINSKTDKYGRIRVNKPKLANGMIPIKYDERKGKWVITNENDKDWYDYSEGKMLWANVMLSDGTYKQSEKNYNEDGTTEVKENELGSMFVWIPRYAYSFNSYHTEMDGGEGTTQKITNVVFLDGTSNRDFEGNSYGTSYNVDDMLKKVGQPTPMIVHQGFNFGGKELTGIWVAKFEASMKETNNNNNTENDVNTGKTIKVLPNAETWRNISVGYLFMNCYNMKNSGNEYGINENEVDTHLIKNIEWGTVAYLSASQYGVVPERNSNGQREGTTGDVYHEYAGGKDYINNVSQSTTKNVTGIYDMCGGSWEYVAAYYDNLDQNLKDNGKDAFTEGRELNTIYAKYWDKYEVDAEERKVTLIGTTYRNYTIWNAGADGNQKRKDITDSKYNLMKNKLGDAMYETIGTGYSYYGKTTEANASGSQAAGSYQWMTSLTGTSKSGTGYYNGDYACIGNCDRPFMIRGGGWGDSTRAGVFASYGINAGAWRRSCIPPSACGLDKYENILNIQNFV